MQTLNEKANALDSIQQQINALMHSLESAEAMQQVQLAKRHISDAIISLSYAAIAENTHQQQEPSNERI